MRLLHTDLHSASAALARLLRKEKERIVFAESCTGGLLAATFTEIPGVSDLFCGSHVVYRDGSKMEWLGVKASVLKRHTAVSAEVAEEMVRGALARTPEATIAASVTGYLGPKGDHVGKVFISVLKRGSTPRAPRPLTLELSVNSENPRRSEKSVQARLERRELAALAVIFLVRSSLEI